MELIDAIVGLTLLVIAVYLAYYIGRKRHGDNLTLRKFLNLFSIVIILKFSFLILSANLLIKSSLDSNFFVEMYIGFVYVYLLCYLLVFPFIIILWVYNGLIWIKRMLKIKQD